MPSTIVKLPTERTSLTSGTMAASAQFAPWGTSFISKRGSLVYSLHALAASVQLGL